MLEVDEEGRRSLKSANGLCNAPGGSGSRWSGGCSLMYSGLQTTRKRLQAVVYRWVEEVCRLLRLCSYCRIFRCC